MKRIISALIVVLLLVTMVTGCKKESNRPFDYDLTKYITLGDFMGIEYTYEVAEVTDEAVTQYVNSALSEKGYGEEVEITDRAVIVGDTANIDYEGKLDGVAFEGGSAQGHDLVIGSNSFIEGFEEGIVGMTVGETKDLKLTFPENYHSEDLKGKSVVFTVKVNAIKNKAYPELTDSIANELSSDCKTVAEYMDYARAQVLAANETNAVNEKENEIWGKIIEGVTVKSFPKDEVENYKKVIIENYDSSLQSQYGITYEEYIKEVYNKTLEDVDADLTAQAEGMLKEYMTIVAIARDQDLELSEEEYKAQADKYAAANGYATTEEFLEAVDESKFQLQLLIDIVMDYVVENAVEVK